MFIMVAIIFSPARHRDVSGVCVPLWQLTRPAAQGCPDCSDQLYGHLGRAVCLS